MAMNRLNSKEINGYRFHLTAKYFLISGLGRFERSNHSGLGNALSKANFKLVQVKQVYALLRSA